MGKALIKGTLTKVTQVLIALALCIGMMPVFSQSSAYADEETQGGSGEQTGAEEILALDGDSQNKDGQEASDADSKKEIADSSELSRAQEAADQSNITTIEEDGSHTYLPEESLSEEEVASLGDEEVIEEEGVLSLSYDPELMAKKSIIMLEGPDRYVTAAEQALYSYKTSNTVIIASGTGYSDSLSATSLAGALNCPILLTAKDMLTSITKDTLVKLKAKNIIIVGSSDVISQKVENDLKAFGPVKRLAGPTRFETQMEIFKYGADKGYWTSDLAIIATGMNFADALAASPIAFALKAPVFFVDGSGALPASQRAELAADKSVKRVIITGSEVVVSANTQSIVQGIMAEHGSSASKVVRLGGPNRFATSAKIAEYAVKNLGFKWDSVAFATGQAPYDALGGGVVQGKQKSVLLLADAVSASAAEAISGYKNSITTNIKFFGSIAAIPASTRVAVCAYLGIDSGYNITSTYYPISRWTMAQYQVNRNEGYGVTIDMFYDALDPFKYPYGDSRFYQHAILTDGHSGVSAALLDAAINKNCIYSESPTKKSALRNTGKYFVEAAKTYGVNEVYLLSNAALESGWGCSDLARGWTPSVDGVVVSNGKSYPYKKGVTYYNFFGIGAYDSNALSGGRAMAVVQGWTSPEKAIKGAAKWISANYLKRSNPAPQNTLYLMKWDVPYAAKYGNAWHEYCTGLTWQTSIASIMGNVYSACGVNMASSGLRFNVPAFAS